MPARVQPVRDLGRRPVAAAQLELVKILVYGLQVQPLLHALSPPQIARKQSRRAGPPPEADVGQVDPGSHIAEDSVRTDSLTWGKREDPCV